MHRGRCIRPTKTFRRGFHLLAAAHHAARSFCNPHQGIASQDLSKLISLTRRRQHFPLSDSTSHHPDPANLLAKAEHFSSRPMSPQGSPHHTVTSHTSNPN